MLHQTATGSGNTKAMEASCLPFFNSKGRKVKQYRGRVNITNKKGNDERNSGRKGFQINECYFTMK
jgi:hypothetical protein